MIIDLTKHIKVITPGRKAMFPFSNSLYIDDDIPTVIEAAAGKKAYQEINPDRIQLLILSHAHFDHINCYKLFPQAKILTGIEDSAYFESFSNFVKNQVILWEKIMDVPYPLFSSAEVVINPKVPGATFSGGLLQNIMDFSVPNNNNFHDRQVISVGKTDITVLHTPGHTQGHNAFYIEKEGILFSGDIDLAPQGPWYADTESYVDQFMKSIQLLIEIDPNIMVTSHRQVFYRKDNIPKLLKEFYDFFPRRSDNVYDHLKVPLTEKEICNKQLEIETVRPHDYTTQFFVKGSIQRHILYLEAQNVIKKTEGGLYVRC